MQYKFHKELKVLSDQFPLTESERHNLKMLLEEKGQIVPILLWDGYVVDGHNRLSVMAEIGMQPYFKNVDFSSLEEAKLFIINNYIGQRNLTDGQKWELIQEKKNMLAERGKEKQATENNKWRKEESLLSVVDKSENHNTRQQLANELGWSTGKVAMADKVWKAAKPEIKEQVKKGEVSINKAYETVRKEEKQKTLAEKRQQYVKESSSEIKQKPIVYINDAVSFLNEIAENCIDLLITDPPYKTDVDDIHRFTADWLPLALEKVKPTGRAYICSGAYPDEIFAFLNVLTKQKKFIVDSPLVWTYRNTLGQTPKMKYNLNYQLIWHLYSKESNELDTSVTNEMFSVQDINAPDGRQGNRLHTWQKPDELARRLIRHSTKKGDKVLDCFACTGTFLIEAARLERQATGCEINPDNAKISEDRGCIIIGK